MIYKSVQDIIQSPFSEKLSGLLAPPAGGGGTYTEIASTDWVNISNYTNMAGSTLDTSREGTGTWASTIGSGMSKVFGKRASGGGGDVFHGAVIQETTGGIGLRVRSGFRLVSYYFNNYIWNIGAGLNATDTQGWKGFVQMNSGILLIREDGVGRASVADASPSGNMGFYWLDVVPGSHVTFHREDTGNECTYENAGVAKKGEYIGIGTAGSNRTYHFNFDIPEEKALTIYEIT